MTEIQDYERRFRHEGLPLFIEGWTAPRDVYTRAAPALAFLYLGEALGAIDLGWSLPENLAAATGGLAILLAAFGLLNHVRGRRIAAVPRRMGIAELVAFVVLPATLPVIFNGQVTSAVVTALVNVGLLLFVYGVVSFGLLSILVWAGRRLFSELARSLQLVSRALPLLLVVSIVLFFNTEMWEVFSQIPEGLLLVSGVLFAGVIILFLAVRVPREVGTLEHDAGGGGPPLNPRQRVNVAMVVVITQLLQVMVVSTAVAAFFIVFGTLTIGPEVRESWTGSTGTELVSVRAFGEEVGVTDQLLRVSSAIAAFSGLYFAISLVTDADYREEFLQGLTTEMSETFKAAPSTCG